MIFTPDGNSLISPIGNRICIYNLKNHTSSTLSVESRFNYDCLALSPTGNLLIAVNEEGEAHFISLVTRRKLFSYRLNEKVRRICFSPDGRYFAICKINKVFVFRAPEYYSYQLICQLVLEKVFTDFYDDTTFIDWTDDSSIIAAGSKEGLVKLYPVRDTNTFQRCVLTGHTDAIKAVFFESDALHINTLGRNGELIIWECNTSLQSISPLEEAAEKRRQNVYGYVETSNTQVRKNRIICVEQKNRDDDATPNKVKTDSKIRYTRLSKHYLNDYHKFEKHVFLNSSVYHKQNRILVTGFSNGSIFIHELPDVSLIHSLSVSDSGIATLTINNLGDWIAVGSEYQGQFIVWEWQSETYVLKQQTHCGLMSCLACSNDGLSVATGGNDGKIKIWNIQSSYCFVTFAEHSSAISDVKFANSGKFVLSSSLDGTVRAFDMYRYRNFRVFTTPRSVQFSCLAIDSTDEFVAAGAQDVFEIYLWSMKLGHLIECLAGHEGPVSGIAFSPVVSSTAFVSVSWDKTLRLWNTIETGKDYDIIELGSEALCVAYKLDGKEIAVATLNGHIMFFNCINGDHVRSIEGRNDLSAGRSITDQITVKKKLESRAFTSISYSVDGSCVIAAGQSKFICLYHIAEGILLKKFEITQNRSLDSIDDFVNHRKITEFGNIDLIEKREDRENGSIRIRLPGVLQGDMATRSSKPEIRVFDIAFSPTGLAWLAVTTEGVLIYSLDSDVTFDPFQLEMDITPDTIRKNLEDKNYTQTLVSALKLGEVEITRAVLENIKPKDIELLAGLLPATCADRLLKITAVSLTSTSHIEFYLIWIEHILNRYRFTNKFSHAIMITLHRNLSKKYSDLLKVCDFNKHTMKFIIEKSKKRSLTDQVQDLNQIMNDESGF